VDDNALLRRGLMETISIEPGLQVVGAAANGPEALALYRQLQPDVVTMDYQMPGEDGVATTQKIIAEFPAARVILLSVFDSDEDIWRAVRAGVKGYLTKKTGEVGVVLEAIRAVAAGETYFPPAIARKLERRSRREDLTEREMSVLKLLAAGLNNQEMADTLGLSLPTIKFHIQNIRQKLQAVDRTQAVVKAYQQGILHLED